mmetsp:Transcript_2616/g.4136  ORF Transcript_2616/g.4136 Transcript_2616/m.4136 type:complete len:218 (+) Transcript_2616:497-1150(+)
MKHHAVTQEEVLEATRITPSGANVDEILVPTHLLHSKRASILHHAPPAGLQRVVALEDIVHAALPALVRARHDLVDEDQLRMRRRNCKQTRAGGRFGLIAVAREQGAIELLLPRVPWLPRRRQNLTHRRVPVVCFVPVCARVPEGVIRKRNVQPVLPCGGGKHRWRSKVNPLLIPRTPKTLVLAPPAFTVLAHHRVVPLAEHHIYIWYVPRVRRQRL